MRTISATDLARNTRKIPETVAGRREIVGIGRNHIVVARTVPPERTMTAAQALRGLEPMISPKKAEEWLEDSKADCDQAVRDP